MDNSLWLVLKARWFNVKDFFITVFRYWRKPSFALTDLTLLMSYFFKSPYRISRQFEEKRSNGEVAPYGETPLSIMQTLVDAASISSHDIVYELGCGRGRTCFWLASWIGCKTVGIEYNPVFVDKAKAVARLYRLPHIEFCCEDMFKSSFLDATVIYLYGTCLSDEEIEKLLKKLEKVAVGTTIITISYSLLDYTKDARFELVDTIEVEFPWGTTEAYIQKIGQ